MTETPRQALRSDVYRIWVAGGVLLAIILAAAAFARSPSSTSGSIAASIGGAKIDDTKSPAHGWMARDPKAPAPLPGTVHKLNFEMVEKLIEVAPGVKQKLWTFNGTVPGPVLRGKVGDTFEITLTNKGSMGHSIDFHASKVAWNVEMRTIQPGQSLHYNFKATKAGIFMYHCGTPPVLDHIANGMYGAVIIDPGDLSPVAHEFYMIQSELYLGNQSDVGDYSKMIAGNYDAVVFNGYYNQYKFEPIKVPTNQKIRVWVLNAGPSESSSFHIIGTIFDTVYKEGAYTLKGGDGGSQALDVDAAQGGFVELTFDKDGLYPFVTHRFKDASKGALGVFAAGKAPATAVSH